MRVKVRVRVRVKVRVRVRVRVRLRVRVRVRVRIVVRIRKYLTSRLSLMRGLLIEQPLYSSLKNGITRHFLCL